jgi:hypothetical protein
MIIGAFLACQSRKKMLSFKQDLTTSPYGSEKLAEAKKNLK